MSSPLPLVYTVGEPAGIGPDLIIALSQQVQRHPVVVLSDQYLLQQRAAELGLTIKLTRYTGQRQSATKGEIYIQHIALNAPSHSGKLDVSNAPWVLETLKLATQGCLQQHYAALVTGPLHKAIINEAGIAFSGHTEYLAKLSNTAHTVMLLTTGNFRVALATTHIPLAQVTHHITRERIETCLTILHHELQAKYKIKQPRITVCGVNPHAGEDGHLGREEIEILEPVITKLKQQGLRLRGPVPADTAFIPEIMRETDAYLSMYHDQALPVLKHVGFGQAVNVTLGLPFIRTSVDHGTALDKAGTGQASVDSLVAAINAALDMVS
jgi:4-hydroxythreonine-4-phosphate dehydrogenase